MILKTQKFHGWTVLHEADRNILDEHNSWTGYKDIPTFSGKERLITPCFRRLVDLQYWINTYNQHHVR